LITYYSQGSQPIDPHRAAVENVVAEPDSLSAYWEQPGRAILDAGLVTVPLPPEDSFDVEASKVISFSGTQRQDIEAALTASGRKVENDEVILNNSLTWELLEKYCRTWSSLSNYLEKYPEEKEKRLSNGGKGGPDGDIVDRFLSRLRNELLKTTGSIPEKVDIEWPVTLLLYRKRV
jgi:trans-aconitate 3-methyltransferase